MPSSRLGELGMPEQNGCVICAQRTLNRLDPLQGCESILHVSADRFVLGNGACKGIELAQIGVAGREGRFDGCALGGKKDTRPGGTEKEGVGRAEMNAARFAKDIDAFTPVALDVD